MAHFYGEVQGNRGGASRCGTKNGLEVRGAGWNIGATVSLWYDKNEKQDKLRIVVDSGNSYGTKYRKNIIELGENDLADQKILSKLAEALRQ